MTVEIGSNAKIEGTIILHQGKFPLKELRLEVDQGLSFYGDIVANGTIEIQRAKIHGTVTAKMFEFDNGAAAIFSNHLLDVQINPFERSKYYAGPRIFENKAPDNTIVKWLY